MYLETLKEIAGKTELQIVFEKTKRMSNDKEAPKKLTTNEFKDFGDVIRNNGLDTASYKKKEETSTTKNISHC